MEVSGDSVLVESSFIDEAAVKKTGQGAVEFVA